MTDAPSPLLDRLARGDALAALQRDLVREADACVVRAFDAYCAAYADTLEVLAVGGYGREEAFPQADLDIVLVYEGADGTEADAEARLERALPGAGVAIRGFVDALRDSGKRLSPRVRSLGEHLRLIPGDVTIAAAALDTRHICGARCAEAPRATARAAIATGFEGGIEAFCGLILEGVRHRHARFGGSTHMLEPELKRGRGGLRDGHAVWWTSGLRFGTHALEELARAEHIRDADRVAFEAAYTFIARTRLAVHAACRWRNDRLAFAHHETVARAMGFGDGVGGANVEAFMQEFYGHADALALTSITWLESWAAPTSALMTQEGVPVRDGRVVLDGDQLTSLDEAATLLRAARDIERRPEAHAMAALRDLAAALPPAIGKSETATALVYEAVAAPSSFLLELLVEARLFEALVPEWGHIVGHMSRDVYHVYTTDRHLIEAFHLVARLDEGDDAPGFVRSAWARIHERGDAEALRVATLLHDVGKALAGDHSMIGAGMSVEIARRIGLDASARDLIRWLVDEHLTLARSSQRRDLTNPATYAPLLEVVPDARHLDALVVLTWADMTSVGPALRTEWKRTQLERAAAGLRACLSGQTLTADTGPWRAVVSEHVGDRATRDVVRDALPEQRWNELDQTEAELAVELLQERLRSQTSVAAERYDEAAQRWLVGVCTKDRRRLLADITGAIGAEGVGILAASVVTTPGGAALDIFELDARDARGQALPERRRTRVVDAVLEACDATYETRRRPRSESRLGAAERPPVKSEVVLAASVPEEGLEVLEVKTRDRVGLLSDLAEVFDAAGYAIVRSIIQIEGDRAIDIFYIRGPAPGGLELEELREALLERIHVDAPPVDT